MWIHLPSSVSTPVVEDSISDSEWLFPMLEQFVTWRGTLRPSKSWSRTCKREGWMKRRSGLIPKPSTASRGVEQWIGSLVASRANRSPLQEHRREPKTTDGSGRTSDASLAKWNPEDFAWRTSQASFWEEYSPYLESWPKTGMTRSGQLFGLPTLVHHIGASDVSSWPTPAARDIKGAYSEESQQLRQRNLLPDVAKAWPTPKERDFRGQSQRQQHGLMDALPNMAERFHLGRQTPMPGQESSQQTRRLNPRFVEMLMGWPLGWTDFVSSETELSRSKQPSPSTSSGSN